MIAHDAELRDRKSVASAALLLVSLRRCSTRTEGPNRLERPSGVLSSTAEEHAGHHGSKLPNSSRCPDGE